MSAPCISHYNELPFPGMDRVAELVHFSVPDRSAMRDE